MQRVFCGREGELKRLQDAYRAVAAAENAGPQLVTLVAESGLGKTRIVQELYRWLSTQVDDAGGAGYWPDDLGVVDSNLEINPDPRRCNNEKPVPFLWWGLRLPDPGARNQAIAGQLAASVDYLTPHLEPIFRTRRLKQGKIAIGKSVGKVALDVAVDLIPFAGLFKTLGEGAVEVGQSVRALWNEGDLASAAELHDRRREDLAARVVADLGLLLSRETDDVAAVPVVIVIDDGQFSDADPSIVTFVEKMMAESVARGWRVLFIVTYWTAEWNSHYREPAPGSVKSVGQVIQERHAAFGDGWQPLMLSPVEDMSSIVAAALPGVTPEQAAALCERAGGNPRYLDEILRFCERNERLFVGRSLTGPLTDKGLAALLEKTVHLHDLVEERLRALDTDVRRAVLLAGAQGQEFIAPLVAEVAAILHEETSDAALERAEHPHAFIHRQSDDLGAFAQRVFHDVAVANVGNDFDEDDVAEALKEAIRRRVDDGNALHDAPESIRIRSCLLATRVLADSDDEIDMERVVYAYARLLGAYTSRHDYDVAYGFGDRLVELLERADPDRVHFFPYFLAAEMLLERGRMERARVLLELALPAQRRRVAEEPTAERQKALSDLLKLDGHCARSCGNLADAERCFREALETDRALAGASPAPGAQRSIMVSLLNIARIAEDRGNLDAQEEAIVEAAALSRALDERVGTVQSREDLSLCLVALGDLTRARGDLITAERYFRQRLTIEDEAADALDNPEAAARRALVLERLGDVALERGDVAAGAAAFDEALTLRRRAADELRVPGAKRDLANLLRHVGDVAWKREDAVAAHAAYQESLNLATEVFAETSSPSTARVWSLAVERMGKLALACDDLDVAEQLFTARLETIRPIAESVQTPKLWRDVMSSGYFLAGIAELREELDEAMTGYRSSLELARALEHHLQTPSAREDVRSLLRRLAALTRARGDVSDAERYEAELAALIPTG